ncbi:CPBP family intramembrane metalloprotease [Agromyces intestinalis]|uniref:CPBP family intramembrane metalloprotease n=1 Tax=Agromyces intestinalis TaxID=2592652 RepID=A0A5C1YCL1_9MICO|nr:CPBP family intramembrane glutamic endopeptidase [Agromyces intestinalis]QEO13348.1 CPBP family intramembrane metalloprotease [Agromyces intestinalis]
MTQPDVPAAVPAAAHVNAAPAALGPADRQRAKNAARGPIFPTSVPWVAVAVYVVIAFAGAWLVALPLWTSGEGLRHPLFGLITPAMMFMPALATLIVVLWVKRPASIPRYLGLSPMRPAGRTWLFIALGFVFFTALPFVAMLLGDVMGLLRLDLSGLSGVQAAIDASGGQGGSGGLDAAAVVALNLALLPFVTALNCVATFGEEIGWRGWLLPSLRPLGTVWALIVSGVIWGLWHAPLILLGYNYQRTDVLGLASMVAFCVLTGFVIGWLRLRSASVWPAVVAHAAINTATAQFLLLADADSLADPAGLWGNVLGWPGWILLLVAIVVIVATGQLRTQPQPGLTLAESQVGRSV